MEVNYICQKALYYCFQRHVVLLCEHDSVLRPGMCCAVDGRTRAPHRQVSHLGVQYKREGLTEKCAVCADNTICCCVCGTFIEIGVLVSFSCFLRLLPHCIRTSSCSSSRYSGTAHAPCRHIRLLQAWSELRGGDGRHYMARTTPSVVAFINLQ